METRKLNEVLYTTAKEKREFIKDPERILEYLHITWLGMLGCKQLAESAMRVKNIFMQEGDLDIQKIDDTNNDMSLVGKLALDAGLIGSTTLKRMLRFLEHLKAKTTFSLDEDYIRKMFSNSSNINKPTDQRIVRMRKEFVDGKRLVELLHPIWHYLKLHKKEYENTQVYDLLRYFVNHPPKGSYLEQLKSQNLLKPQTPVPVGTPLVPKRRGRPPKNRVGVPLVAPVSVSTIPPANVPVASASPMVPKKRGRPRKNPVMPTVNPTPTPASTAQTTVPTGPKLDISKINGFLNDPSPFKDYRTGGLDNFDKIISYVKANNLFTDREFICASILIFAEVPNWGNFTDYMANVFEINDVVDNLINFIHDEIEDLVGNYSLLDIKDKDKVMAEVFALPFALTYRHRNFDYALLSSFTSKCKDFILSKNDTILETDNMKANLGKPRKVTRGIYYHQIMRSPFAVDYMKKYVKKGIYSVLDIHAAIELSLRELDYGFTLYPPMLTAEYELFANFIGIIDTQFKKREWSSTISEYILENYPVETILKDSFLTYPNGSYGKLNIDPDKTPLTKNLQIYLISELLERKKATIDEIERYMLLDIDQRKSYATRSISVLKGILREIKLTSLNMAIMSNSEIMKFIDDNRLGIIKIFYLIKKNNQTQFFDDPAVMDWLAQYVTTYIKTTTTSSMAVTPLLENLMQYPNLLLALLENVAYPEFKKLIISTHHKVLPVVLSLVFDGNSLSPSVKKTIREKFLYAVEHEWMTNQSTLVYLDMMYLLMMRVSTRKNLIDRIRDIINNNLTPSMIEFTAYDSDVYPMDKTDKLDIIQMLIDEFPDSLNFNGVIARYMGAGPKDKQYITNNVDFKGIIPKPGSDEEYEMLTAVYLDSTRYDVLTRNVKTTILYKYYQISDVSAEAPRFIGYLETMAKKVIDSKNDAFADTLFGVIKNNKNFIQHKELLKKKQFKDLVRFYIDGTRRRGSVYNGILDLRNLEIDWDGEILDELEKLLDEDGISGLLSACGDKFDNFESPEHLKYIKYFYELMFRKSMVDKWAKMGKPTVTEITRYFLDYVLDNPSAATVDSIMNDKSITKGMDILYDDFSEVLEAYIEKKAVASIDGSKLTRIVSDQHNIMPIDDVVMKTPNAVVEYLKFNDPNMMTKLPIFDFAKNKKNSGEAVPEFVNRILLSSLDFNEAINKRIPDPKLTLEKSGKDVLHDLTLEINYLYNGRRHDLGNGYQGFEIEKEYSPTVRNESKFMAFHDEMRANGVNPTILNPVFHGTGTLAANMISRYNFVFSGKVLGHTGDGLGRGLYFAPGIDKAMSYMFDKLSEYGSSKGNSGFVYQCRVLVGKRISDNTSTYDERLPYSNYRDSRGNTYRSSELIIFTPEVDKVVIIDKVYFGRIINVDEYKLEMEAKGWDYSKIGSKIIDLFSMP